jgi:hypothetical protein
MAAPKRHRKRIKVVLPIRVWGTDANGKPFVSLSHTLDVTPTGARIGGVTDAVAPGDRVGITRGMKKAHFRVAWVGTPGTPSEGQIGVELLEAGKDIWGLRLPDPEPDHYATTDKETAVQASPVQAMPQTDSDLADQLRKTAAQLHQMEQLTHNGSTHSLVKEFRSSFIHARNTAEALERTLSQPGADDSYSLRVAVNSERVRVASSLCAELARDLCNVRSMIPRSSLEQLLQHVGDLFAQLSNFEIELDETPAESMDHHVAERVSPGRDNGLETAEVELALCHEESGHRTRHS